MTRGGTVVTVTLHTDPVPLRVDETGTIRVGSSRITLDVLLADYGRQGGGACLKG